MNKDTLGNRMKKYERASNNLLTPRMPVLIRVDGKAFHTFTRGCDKPFDRTIIDAMAYATKKTAEHMQGFKLAYVQSDESTFMITDTDTLETQGWFNYEINKLVSITASAFTAYFNSYWFNYKAAANGFASTDGETKFGLFDARAFNVPAEDVPNAFIWRQRDWERNSVQMMARSLYSQKQLQGKKVPALLDMIADRSVNSWEEINPQLKYGTWIEHDGKMSFDKLDYATLQEKITAKQEEDNE
jgi:tRNA(His) guanylyltransferase